MSTRAVGYRALGHGQGGLETVGIAEVEEQAFGKFAGHAARFQVDHEQSLLPFNLARICAFFADAGKNGARVIAKIHDESHQFFRLW